MTQKILIFGANGQVGKALKAIYGEDAVALGRDEADLSKPNSLVALLESYNPHAIINAAAYTAVDKAEEEEALATIINADSPAVMARFAKENYIPFIHYSTDYVFEGQGITSYTEDAPTAPQSAYGRSKHAGEKAIEAIGGKYLIFRTSWVYDRDGKNFVNTMLRLGSERNELNIVADQVGAPSYAPDIAACTKQALDNALGAKFFPSGIYHLCGGGETNWCEFATEIFNLARQQGKNLAIKTVNPISSAEYPTPATRPLNSRMDCSKARQMLGIEMPHWQESLKSCMR